MKRRNGIGAPARCRFCIGWGVLPRATGASVGCSIIGQRSKNQEGQRAMRDGLTRPEIHARALAAKVPLGRIVEGREIGLAGRHKFIWDACPICSARRWVELENKGRWCRSCNAKRPKKILAAQAAAPRITERRRLLYRMGRAAEAAGLTLSTLVEWATARASAHALTHNRPLCRCANCRLPFLQPRAGRRTRFCSRSCADESRDKAILEEAEGR